MIKPVESNYSILAAGIARSSQLSSPCQGRRYGHSFITVQITAPLTLSSSEANRLAFIFTASPLVFALIVTNRHFLHAMQGRVMTLGPSLAVSLVSKHKL